MASTVNSFPPEFVELYRLVGVPDSTPITISLPSTGKAVRFRQLMYMLRVAMRAEQHPILPLAENVEVVLDQEKAIVRRKEFNYAEAIRMAGVASPPPSPAAAGADLLSSPASQLPSQQLDVERVIDDFLSGSGGTAAEPASPDPTIPPSPTEGLDSL